MYHIHVLSVVLAISHSASAIAVPHSHLRPRQSSESGGGGGSPGSIQKEIWIPLVVIAVLFVLGAAIACTGRRLRRSVLVSWGNSAAQAAGLTTGTAAGSTLTAEQLAGTTRVTTTTETTTRGTVGRTRTRRTRRTPSQMSTHSLPAYNKEPGEQEIVIVRSEESDDDIHVTMPPVAEHGSENQDSFDLTRTSYSPVPNAANDVPLLRVSTRSSTESDHSSVENSLHDYTDAAPPYETVVLNDTIPPRSPSPAGHETAPASFTPSLHEREPSTGTTRRRSMFSSIFNPRSSRIGATPPAASPDPQSSSGHTRDNSDPSVVSLSPSPVPSNRRMVHHQTSFSSGSMLSLLRTKSNMTPNGAEALTSPSMISLHSISSPLVHTVRKTELIYGKAGPTADQIRLLSNRESIARFGKPYGDEAVAHAASTSHLVLPPPAFEEVEGSSNARSSSPTHPREDTPSSGLLSPAEELDEVQANVTSPSEPSPSETADPTLHALVDAALESELPAPTTAGRSVHRDSAGSLLGQTESAVETPSVAVTTAIAITSASPVLADCQASIAQSSAAPTVTAKTTIGNPTSQPPPSAFKAVAPASIPARTASRASSYMSYATAEESLHSPSAFDSQYDLQGYESAIETPSQTPTNISAPPTPRLGPRHAQEPTDTTITLGR